MKTFVRNLLSIIRRFKVPYVLNILGSSAAFAAFMVIMMQIVYEQSFDTCYSKSDRIFRLERNVDHIFGQILERGFIDDFINSSPHIESGIAMFPFNADGYFVSTDANGAKKGFNMAVNIVYPSIVDIFDFDIIDGSAQCLNAPDQVLLPASIAKKIWGTEFAVGKTLSSSSELWLSYGHSELTVGGVYADFPAATQLVNCLYLKCSDELLHNYSSANFICYVLLDNAANADDVVNSFNAKNDFNALDSDAMIFSLTPIKSIYYKQDNTYQLNFRNGNKAVTYSLFCIAIIVIFVSTINHINFNLALAPMRIRSVNTQKVLGCSSFKLKMMFIAESVLTTFFAWCMALLIIKAFSGTWLMSFFTANISLTENLPVCLLTGLFAIILGGLAGIYPAKYVTSLNPAFALKGSSVLSPIGRRLRMVLVAVQFVASFIFIASAIFVWLQNDYMRTKTSGLNTDQVLIVKLSDEFYANHHETYVNKLKEYAGIENVAFTMQKIGASDGYNTLSSVVDSHHFSYYQMYTSPEILDVFDIKVIDGRAFQQSDVNGSEEVLVINDIMRKDAHLTVGQTLEGARVVGVIDDINITSMRHSVFNTCFSVGGKYEQFSSLPFSYVRVKASADIDDVIDHIQKTIASIDPAYPTEVEFYDEVLNNLYKTERSLCGLIVLFALLAICISIFGVFGMVVFDCEFRKKEIGLRRVFGATTTSILYKFNKIYLQIIVVCFVVATPVTCNIINRWLQNFAYRIPIYWWVFLITFVLVLLITTATVTFQTYNTANDNPVKSLKNE